MSAIASAPPSKTLFIGGIGDEMTVDELKNIFGRYSGFLDGRLRQDHLNNQVGFAEFTDEDAARRALEDADGMVLPNSRKISVAYAKAATKRRESRYERDDDRGARGDGYDRSYDDRDRDRGYHPYGGPPQAESNTLYVEGVPRDATQREMTHIFRPFHGYLAVRLIKNSRPKRSDDRDYFHCFVEFMSPQAAYAAMENLQSYQMDYDDPTGLKIEYSIRKTRRPGGDRPPQ
mmetsp:Transcript_35813/g.55958  ORF Transcript_35813/g.55958 Transcript_35813/m.55958 type:complete len:232 (-) Transcript_35813:222-917(-)|eukprot:CAMPEP_0201540680 /NCGR_PEP_ID=MMETSP0161_2-20130828/71072_1 /ASSEMBLY_ACC=CAM_ASM_000251 /TAXON_ID=180227 /ORGANISM="Neoparamoeba aestuarina, Strain SoJaBio B1-5/56/2" /LENGTH=231 /DNA_ID=CAMNT_0047948165 /DNA_START=75 /DNA_END=770 /DNA_ORIENTATION=+